MAMQCCLSPSVYAHVHQERKLVMTTQVIRRIAAMAFTAALVAGASSVPASAEVRSSGVSGVAAETQAALPMDIWGDVFRVFGSKNECEVFLAFVVRPFFSSAYCVANPDENGTWLLIYHGGSI